MVKFYKGNSPRNARIRIDYTGEYPSVRFKYPRKDGWVGSMLPLLQKIWLFFLLVFFIIFPSLGYIQDGTPIKRLIHSLIIVLIVFLPPILIERIFKKKLGAIYPIYRAWLAKKKYVEFETKDVKTLKINGKKEIYVEIPYFENVILKYEATEDFSKYLDIMEIKEHNFKIEEYSKKEIRKKVKKQNEWYWYAKFYFNKVPKKGKLKVIFK